MKRYELLDHTADIEMVAFGRDLPEAFGNAAYGMFDLITNADEIREVDSFNLQVAASDTEELLVAWLDELLYKYETERIICRRFDIEDMSGTSLKAVVYGEKLDLGRHEVKLEIKSVTYHQLKVEEMKDGWKVQVIFDV